jgi:hypothetical protein
MVASITTSNRRRALKRWRMLPSDRAMWQQKRARQRASLASGVNGAWFVGGMAQRAIAVNSPY